MPSEAEIEAAADVLGWWADKVKARDMAVRVLEAAERARWQPAWRHKKRGTAYEEVGSATIQTDNLIGDNTVVLVYRDENGKMWARTPLEFNDGRFEPLLSSPESKT